MHRDLTDGGLFLTQQRTLDATELFAFGPSDALDFDVGFAVTQLERHGFRILRLQSPMYFFDIGALVYYLRAVPWVVPGFDARSQRDDLYRLNDLIGAQWALLIPGTHMLVVAVRSAE